MSQTRRLAAILAADVAGYSRLIGADEEGTGRIRALRAELIDPKIAAHNGRLVKTTGDGLLVEFASVVDALRCATEVQAGMAERNATTPADKRIEFRIGLHQGDIVVEDGDIFGDGVNVAARLEGLAEPGRICVSARVQEDAVGKLDLTFDDMGDQALRNISRPVRAYRVVMERRADAAKEPAPLPLPDKPSIAALPFQNMSGDPEQDYFADGMVEEIITALSRIRWLFVIARNSTFTYKGQAVDVKQVGRELGVRYVLEGSVQRSGQQVRVNAQLIDAESDAHLWAERFDGATSDLLALQSEITSRIATALNLALVGAEAARPTERPDALDYVLRGRAAYWNAPRGLHRYAEAIDLLERALLLDPHSVEAQSYLASALTVRGGSTYAADIERAEGLIKQALATSPLDPMAHYARAQLLRAQRRWSEAILEYEVAIASNRNWATAYANIGDCKLWIGSLEETIPLEQQAIRLSPRDPNIGYWYEWIGNVHLLESRTDEAIAWFEKARNADPEFDRRHARLASAYALKGENERAAAELAEARRLAGDDRFSSIARLSRGNFGVPKVRALFEATYFAGLRKAGMPEE